MKKLFSMTGWMLLCLMAANAQSNPSASSPPVNNKTGTAQGISASALTESDRLGAAVVELFNAGKLDEALPLAKQALEIRERALGVDQLSVVPFLNNLGEIYLAKHKYGEAQPLFQRALAINEQKLGANHLNVSDTLITLGYISIAKGRKEETEAFYQRALAIREKVLGADDMKVSDVACLLADFYRLTKQFEKAEPLYVRAINIRGKSLGGEHPDFWKAVGGFDCLFYQSKPDESYEEWDERTNALIKPFIVQKKKEHTGEVLNGRAISLPKPTLPTEARQGHYGGVVVVKVTIDENGKVTSASDACGSEPHLYQASKQAAMRALFSPPKIDGQPMKVSGVIIYRFMWER